MSAIDHYLSRYAEPETGLSLYLKDQYHQVLTLPVYAEGEELALTLNSIPYQSQLLVVVVLNAGHDASNAIRQCNEHSLEWIAQNYRLDSSFKNASLFKKQDRSLLVIERFRIGNELPSKQGVGLARKIAADLSLALFAQQKLKSHWIHCTDADVLLPQDYFHQSQSKPAVAEYYPFEHQHPDQTLNHHAQLYELSLRYHTLGLFYAGSPYAYHSIGSTLRVDTLAYAQVRGFPKRAAGEDFYLLNKLRKLGHVMPLHGSPLKLSGRISNRVPFGTGTAVQALHARGNHALFYHPKVYDLLATFLIHCQHQLESSEFIFPTSASFHSSYAEANLIKRALETLNYLEGLKTLWHSYQNPTRRAEQILVWFDALKTLKFIHTVTHMGWPKCALSTELLQAPCLLEACQDTNPQDLNLLNRKLDQRQQFLLHTNIRHHA